MARRPQPTILLMRAERREADGMACGMEGGLGKGWDGGCGRKLVPCGGAGSALWSFSTGPAWWWSRRLLACQLNTGSQTGLKVLPGPGAAIFLHRFFPALPFGPSSSHAFCFVHRSKAFFPPSFPLIFWSCGDVMRMLSVLLPSSASCCRSLGVVSL